MKNTDQITARIEAAERELAEAKRQLAEATKPDVPKYAPMSGRYYFGSCMAGGADAFEARQIVQEHSRKRVGAQGRAYKSPEAAQASADCLNWFIHLLNLAAQLNPSGKAGGNYAVDYHIDKWDTSNLVGLKCVACVFETREAAQKAAAILNASGGKLAGVPCPFISKA